MIRYQTRPSDFPHLFLPDGRRADSLRLIPLRAELDRLKVPGTTAAMGKLDLLEAFNRHVEATANELRTMQASYRGPLTDTAARAAAAFIEKQVAA